MQFNHTNARFATENIWHCLLGFNILNHKSVHWVLTRIQRADCLPCCWSPSSRARPLVPFEAWPPVWLAVPSFPTAAVRCTPCLAQLARLCSSSPCHLQCCTYYPSAYVGLACGFHPSYILAHYWSLLERYWSLQLQNNQFSML